MRMINPSKLRPGLIWHHRKKSMTCTLIRRVLSIRSKIPCWGCHDGIVIQPTPYVYEAYIGDSLPFRSRYTPLSHYNDLISKGKLEVRIYEVVGASHIQERRAAAYWMAEVQGTIYDFGAYPLLLLKALFGDISPLVAGWEWASWCTEGVMMSYLKEAGIDPWNKRNATPKTTENRVRSGALRDITEDMLI